MTPHLSTASSSSEVYIRLISQLLYMPSSSPESLVPLLHFLQLLFPRSPIKTWNLFCKVMLNLLNTSSFLKFAVWYLTLHFFLSVVCLLSLNLTTVHTRWWSLPISADLYTLVSFFEFLNRQLISTWSIWFMVFPPGETHVTFGWSHVETTFLL